jgi:hypothetical protein
VQARARKAEGAGEAMCAQAQLIAREGETKEVALDIFEIISEIIRSNS